MKVFMMADIGQLHLREIVECIDRDPIKEINIMMKSDMNFGIV